VLERRLAELERRLGESEPKVEERPGPGSQSDPKAEG
jgi:hypothetical protein